MISWMIYLVSSYTQSGIFEYVLYYIFALAFVATIPCFIRSLIRR